MNKNQVVYAFIDGQNLHLGVLNDVLNKKGRKVYSGKRLDYKKFRNYLREKYGVTRAYLFLGMVPDHNSLYTHLQQAGFTLVFKQVLWYYDADGELVVKGNVDTDITLYSAAKLVDEYDKAIFVSGDGDFLSTYQHIDSLGKLGYIFVPNRYRYSRLLNHYRRKMRFVSDLRGLFTANKKTRSGGRKSSLGLPGHGDTKSLANKRDPVNTTNRDSRTAKQGKRGKK
jgi:uncharacterized LabA/DUF88 family protein